LRQSHKTVLLWITLIFAFVAIWQILNNQRAEEKRILFSAFTQDVDQHPEKFKAGGSVQANPPRSPMLTMVLAA